MKKKRCVVNIYNKCFDIHFWAIKLNGLTVPFVSTSVRNGCCVRVAKRCKIRPRLLLISNKKWHAAFQMTRKLLTLDDLKGQYELLWLNSSAYLRNDELRDEKKR